MVLLDNFMLRLSFATQGYRSVLAPAEPQSLITASAFPADPQSPYEQFDIFLFSVISTVPDMIDYSEKTPDEKRRMAVTGRETTKSKTILCFVV